MRVHSWQQRLVDHVVDRLGGEVEWPYYNDGYAEPDYYTDEGIPVYDMDKRLCMLQSHKNDLSTMLNAMHREVPAVINWMEDDFMERLDPRERWGDWTWEG